MPTFQDALFYLGIDEVDDMITANVNRAMATAAKRLLGAIGSDVETYLPDDPRIEELVLIYTRESYDADSLTDKARAAMKHQRDDLEPQLRLELRGAKEKAGVI
jgi:hypothetical protein